MKYSLRNDYRQAHSGELPIPAQLAAIRAETGRSPVDVVFDWFSLRRGPGRLTFSDYVFYRLFDEAAHDPAARRRFISESIYYRLMFARVEMGWWGSTEDKFLLYSLLDGHGVPATPTLAVIDAGERVYGRYPVCRTAAELEGFLGEAEFPLFLKPVMGVASSGALLVQGVSEGRVELSDGRSIPVREFFESEIGGAPYLVQGYVRSHPDLAAVSTHLATVRCYNFWIDGELRVVSTLLKMIGGDNVADNYWREGNMLAAVDPADGRLTRVVTGAGFTLRRLEAHPETGRVFSEVRLPFWPEIRALNEECARLYAPIAYSSSDIAITADGPVVVEVNTGGAFTLPQLASGRGFLSDEVAGFFGISLAAPSRRTGRRKERAAPAVPGVPDERVG